ncbi:hypothetical protein [Desulfosediminicola sp.]|uniref:hypothetical protein n=1 Tax=Desulfosediminicola sp. TaxID=2886825 RepID=UPI003AF24CDB
MNKNTENPVPENSATASTKPSSSYGCGEYREEMILAALQRSLQNPELTDQQKQTIEKQVRELEISMGL